MLSGIRILDFSQYLPGPFASLRLADMGAEVIKIESPAGDLGRYPLEEDGDYNYLFRAQNRSKKSVVLNLKETEQQNKAYALIRNADVIIESFRPGVMKRFHLSYEEVAKENPRIIYCSLSGYGQQGSMSHLGSHDLNYMALSGVLSQLKDSSGKPTHPSITFADLIAGMAASESILAALFQRQQTGIGKYIDLALADVMITLMNNHTLIESATGYPYGIEMLNKKYISYFLYETKDQRYVSLAALEPKFWENFCVAIGREEWISSHQTSPSEDNPIYHELIRLFKSKTLVEWARFSQEVDCCMAPVLETRELMNHPYCKERSLLGERWGLHYTATRYVAGNPQLAKATPHPKLGEHTETMWNNIV
ncbi:MAG TPA: CoA transferase [Bacillota bacterium]|nr:CoA transferase [Bacillota bacterium]